MCKIELIIILSRINRTTMKCETLSSQFVVVPFILLRIIDR